MCYAVLAVDARGYDVAWRVLSVEPGTVLYMKVKAASRADEFEFESVPKRLDFTS